MKLSICSEINFQSFSNCLSVKLGLSTGQCQILKNHLPLVGSIENDLLELESINDLNEKIKRSYLLQDAVVVVTSDNELENDSSIYIYAKRMLELSSSLSLQELMEDLNTKRKSLEFELTQLKLQNENDEGITTSKIIILNREIKFLEKAYALLKDKNI